MKKLFAFTLAFLCFSSASANQTHHFFSLKSSEVNLRVGPGEEYPVIWLLTKAGLPVMLIAEFNNWRKVQLVDGTEGWIHVNIISRKNTAIVKSNRPDPSPRDKNPKNKEEEPFFAVMYKYNSKSRPIARVEENVVVRVLKKEDEWIKVEVNKIRGWIERKYLWGVEN